MLPFLLHLLYVDGATLPYGLVPGNQTTVQSGANFGTMVNGQFVKQPLLDGIYWPIGGLMFTNKNDSVKVMTAYVSPNTTVSNTQDVYSVPLRINMSTITNNSLSTSSDPPYNNTVYAFSIAAAQASCPMGMVAVQITCGYYGNSGVPPFPCDVLNLLCAEPDDTWVVTTAAIAGTFVWNNASVLTTPYYCPPSSVITNLVVGFYGGAIGVYCSYYQVKACYPGFTFTNGTCYSKQCDPVATYQHVDSVMNAGDGSYPSQVTFGCSTGYRWADGSNNTYRAQNCTANGSWTGSMSDCVAIICPTLNATSLMVVQQTNTTWPAWALYTCISGYEIANSVDTNDTGFRECYNNGTWSAGPPDCIGKQCPALVLQGNVTNITVSNGGRYPSTANYTCPSGLTAFPSSTRTCDTTGAWSTEPYCAESALGPLASTPEWTMDFPATFYTHDTTVFTLRYTANTPPPNTPIVWAFYLIPWGTGPTLILPPYSLWPGSYYVHTSVNNYYYSGYEPFTVTRSAVSAVVTGGDRDVVMGTQVVLGASGSDPDIPPPGNAGYLQYTWNLTSCPTSIASVVGGGLRNPTLILQTNSPGNCIVSVNVSSAPEIFATSTTITQTSLHVVAVPANPINLTISGPQTISSSDTLRLLATVSATQPSAVTIYRWSVTPSLQSSTTGVDCSLPPLDVSSSRSLSLAAACLIAGTSYRFTFTVGDAQSTIQAWINVIATGAPTGGICTISPLSGVAVSTVFNVTCTGWTSQGSSNSAGLGYAIKDQSNAIITPLQYPTTLTFLLPASPPGGTVLIANIYYANSVTAYPLSKVTVTPPVSCPLQGLGVGQDGNPSLQDLTSVFQQVLTLPPATCSFPIRNTTWTLFWNQLQNTTKEVNETTLQQATVDFLITSFQTAVANVPTATSASPASILQLMQWFANNTQTSAEASSLLNVSSSLFGLLTGNCQATNQLVDLLAVIVRRSTAGNLPSDPSLTVDSSALSLSSSFLFGDSSTTQTTVVNGGNIQVNVPLSLVAQGGSVSALTITNYGTSRDPSCRSGASSSSSSASPIVDISLSSRDGTLISVTNSQPLSFTLPISDGDLCGNLQCMWWDAATQEWNATGCTLSETPDLMSRLCTCTHLTEFSLIIQPAQCTKYRDGYLTFMVLYLLVGGVALMKLVIRFAQYSGLSRKFADRFPAVVWQHVIVVVLAIIRVIGCAVLSVPQVSQSWSVASRAVLFVAPYMAVFWIYTLLVFQWAAIYHLGMKYRAQAFAQVRWLFVFSNVVVCAAVIAMIASIAQTSESDEKRKTVSEASTIIIAIITATTAFAFLVYVVLVVRSMASAGTNTGSKSVMRNGEEVQPTWLSRLCDLSLRHRMILNGTIICTLLCLECAMHITSVVAQRKGGPIGKIGGDVSELVLLGADWTNLVVLLVMYHRAMHYDGAPTNKERQSSQHNRPSQPLQELRTAKLSQSNNY